MLYNKQATTINRQIEMLAERGMGGDHALMRRWLETVGYYRLSAYWLPYELPPENGEARSKRFTAGIDFASIVDIYVFDRKLRLLIMEAMERVEIALRARWTNRLALAYGSHAYLDAQAFEPSYDHPMRVSQVAGRVRSSREVFVEHYGKKYDEPFLPPIWAVTELMTFGELSRWFADTRSHDLQSTVAKDLGMPSRKVLIGTLQLLSYVRNICAHHGRLWNRQTVKRLPLIKRLRADLVVKTTTVRGSTQSQPANYVYNAIVVLVHLLRHQSHDTTFPARMLALVETRTNRQRASMGFPSDWKERPCWKQL